MSDPIDNPVDKVTIGVVVERRAIDDKWRDHEWRAVDLLVGVPPATEWRKLIEGDGWTRYLAASVDLCLYKDETYDYRTNLTSEHPYLYVVLRPDEDFDSPNEIKVFHVTASPYEAGCFGQAGDESIECLPVPPEIAAWIAAFVEKHHVEKPFVKRQRDRYDPEKSGFGRRGPRPEGGR